MIGKTAIKARGTQKNPINIICGWPPTRKQARGVQAFYSLCTSSVSKKTQAHVKEKSVGGQQAGELEQAMANLLVNSGKV